MTQEDSTPRKRAGCLRWGLRILGGLAIVLVVLLGAGYVYQIRTTRADFERFPPYGQQVPES
jgi:hypothetical protein